MYSIVYIVKLESCVCFTKKNAGFLGENEKMGIGLSQIAYGNPIFSFSPKKLAFFVAQVNFRGGHVGSVFSLGTLWGSLDSTSNKKVWQFPRPDLTQPHYFIFTQKTGIFLVRSV